MGVFQLNLKPDVVVLLGAVYTLPSGLYVRVLDQNSVGWQVQAVSPRDMSDMAAGAMTLTGLFIWVYGRLCWTAEQWQTRADRVAAEVEAVRLMRERRALAAEQDVARAREIDAQHALKKIADAREKAANRAVLRLAA